jgi:hypothetical protein
MFHDSTMLMENNVKVNKKITAHSLNFGLAKTFSFTRKFMTKIRRKVSIFLCFAHYFSTSSRGLTAEFRQLNSILPVGNNGQGRCWKVVCEYKKIEGLPLGVSSY